MKNGRRGFGSLNFASNTRWAVARSVFCAVAVAAAAARGVSRLASRRGGGGAGGSSASDSSRAGGRGASARRSSLRISSGAEMSGSSARVVTCLTSAATVASGSAAGSGASSLLARRCASSLAFSAFLRASSSKLMSAARIRLQEIVGSGQQLAQARDIPIDARIADHRGAQEDHQLGLLVQVLALRERLADAGNVAHARDRKSV